MRPNPWLALGLRLASIVAWVVRERSMAPLTSAALRSAALGPRASAAVFTPEG
jgi:hypothetical protein